METVPPERKRRRGKSEKREKSEKRSRHHDKSDKSEKHRHRDEKLRDKLKKKHRGKRHHSSHTQDHHPTFAASTHDSSSDFKAFVQAHPSSCAEMRSLLILLDEGQAVVLDQIADTALRAWLRAALEALGLSSEALPDGSVAFAAPDGSRLSARYAKLLHTDTSAIATEEHEEHEVEAQVPSPKRVYGAAAPPSSGREGAVSNIGPMLPSVTHESAADDDSNSSSSSQVGPSLPTGETSSAAVSGDLWWQREQSAPKPTAAIVDAQSLDSSGARDGWMVSLPTERSDLNTNQTRQFLRNGRELPGDLSAWTDAPADRDRKVAAAASTGGGILATSGQPMTLAEAVAIASANAAAGKRPKASFVSETSGRDKAVGDGPNQPAVKSLVEVHGDIRASESQQKAGKADWEGHHPWRPWNRDTDLDVRAANPKGKESILNNNVMGTLGDRFGSSRRESTFM